MSLLSLAVVLCSLVVALHQSVKSEDNVGNKAIAVCAVVFTSRHVAVGSETFLRVK